MGGTPRRMVWFMDGEEGEGVCTVKTQGAVGVAMLGSLMCAETSAGNLDVDSMTRSREEGWNNLGSVPKEGAKE